MTRRRACTLALLLSLVMDYSDASARGVSYLEGVVMTRVALPATAVRRAAVPPRAPVTFRWRTEIAGAPPPGGPSDDHQPSLG